MIRLSTPELEQIDERLEVLSKEKELLIAKNELLAEQRTNKVLKTIEKLRQDAEEEDPAIKEALNEAIAEFLFGKEEEEEEEND